VQEPVLRWSDYALDTDEDAVRARFATFLEHECSLDRVRAAEPLGFDDKLWRQLLELGALDVRGMLDVVLAAEEHGRHLAPVPFVESVVAARILARHDGGAAVLDDVVSRGQVVTIALQTVPSGEAQLVPAAPVADVVVGLDGDDLIAVAGREPPRALVNLGRVPLGRCSLTGGDRTVLAAMAFNRGVDDPAGKLPHRACDVSPTNSVVPRHMVGEESIALSVSRSGFPVAR